MTFSAFSGCDSLESVVIPDSVASIGDYAFSGCDSLASVVIPDSVTSIGDYAFSGCDSLASVVIPDSVTSIGECAFSGCDSLESVVIPDSVTSIGGWAFYNCSSLESIVIPDSVTSIGGWAFEDCSSLTSVVIGDSVTSIGSSAFYGCSSLTSVTFKDTNNWSYTSNSDYTGGTAVDVTNTAQNATYLKSNKCWYKYSETTVTVTADNVTDAISKLSKGGNHTVKVTGAITADIITSIKTALNNNFSAYVNLDLSDTTGLISIGEYAFRYCSSLTKVIIPDSVTSIGYYAFEGCDSLESVYITDLTAWMNIKFSSYANPLSNGAKLYLNGSLVTDLVIPYSVTSIGEYAFNGCSSLESVVIPDSVTSIGSYAFNGCSSLASVVIGDCVTSIDEYAFNGCSSLKSVVIPDSVTSIGNSAFSNCSSLTSVVIPDSVTSISKHAFYKCSSLTKVTIPDGVTSIGEGAFSGCDSLASVTIPNSVTSIGRGAFIYCSSLESVVIPDSVTSIGGSAFYGCDSLASVTFKDTNNWSYTSNSDYTGGTAVDVTNTAQNATYLKSTYDDKYWYKYSETTVTVTADNVTDAISKLSKGGNHTVKVTGAITADIITSISIVLNNNFSAYVNLDLSDTTGLTSIGYDAFRGCDSLTNIVIPDSVTSIGDDAFIGCNSLTSVTIPDSVTSIGYSAFYNCDSLTSVTIPDSVTSIGKYAFYGCSRLTSVTFKDTNNWYYTSNSNYTGGTAVDVTDKAQNATYLKNTYCYKYWYKYLETTVTVTADNVTDAISKLSKGGNHTVKVTGAITSDTISSIKTALQNNSNAKVNLDLSDTTGLTSIGGENAFRGCSSLTSVTIPDSVTFIGENAFSDCNNIKTLITGNGLTSLDNLPLTSALKFINIGSRINSINENVFNLCNDLTIFKVDENNQNYSASEDKKILFNKDKTTLIAYPSAAGDITIPDGVTTITSNAFNGCSNLTNVTIPDSITSIENKAFEGCNSLTSVTFKDTNNWFYTTNSNYTDKMQIDVADTAQNATYLKDSYCNYYLYKYLETTITVTADNVTDGISKLSKGGNHTVKVTGEITADTISSIKTALNNNNCAKVNLDLSDTTGLTSIGWDAFRDCTNLTSVVIPDSVTSVGYNAFFNCNNIETLVIGNGLTSLNYLPITSALKSITIGNGINSINERTFNSCNNLTIFNVDENNQNYSVSEDGKILFNKDKTTLITCSSAANDVTIPDSVTTVNSGAFVNCKNVETLVIGNGLTSLDNLPIASSLKSITIGNNIKSIGYNTFKGCNKLASVTIGNRVTSIDDNAFRDCSSLTSVTIPDSVTEIGNYAFSSCGNLTSVTIGSNVTSIGEYAFQSCRSLTSVVIPDSVAKIDSSAFSDCGNLTSVTFEDIKNWSVVISSGKKKKMNVKNVSKNATNLTQNYCGNEWIKE